jgi:hypothetical protein
LASAGLAGPAAAFVFTPPSTGFSATGGVTLTKPSGESINCTLMVKGNTTAVGKARITGVSFLPGVKACANTAGPGTPWPAVATAANKGKIMKVQVIGAFTGNCGPSVVPIAVNAAGVWSFANAPLSGGCIISGALPTSPRITVIP